MSYVIGQYNHNRNSGDDSSFIELVTEGTARRRQNQSDTGGGDMGLSPFEDECVQTTALSPSKYYYFRCYIKRMPSEQTFYVKLVNYDTTVGGAPEQYLKTITIQGGIPDEWVSVDLVFHPVIQFDTILFQLQRSLEDYRSGTRYPLIAYQELGSINNIINSKIATGIKLLKIGVQSHPGLSMCINGEEIHTSRSGIYELKNGVMPANFFSVVNAAKEVNEGTGSMKEWMANIGAISLDIEEQVEAGIITREQASEIYAAMSSKSFFDTSKTIEIDPFILDYMYEE